MRGGSERKLGAMGVSEETGAMLERDFFEHHPEAARKAANGQGAGPQHPPVQSITPLETTGSASLPERKSYE